MAITRWLFPEGPLPLSLDFANARAWWIIDFARIQADRAAGRVRDLSVEIPQGLALARERLLAFLNDLPRHLPIDYKKTVIGGFSQGAMLTCDAVLHTDYPWSGLIQLSSNLLAQPVWGPLMPTRRLPVFQGRGTQDDILPHIGAERLRDALHNRGLLLSGTASEAGTRSRRRCYGDSVHSSRRVLEHEHTAIRADWCRRQTHQR